MSKLVIVRVRGDLHHSATERGTLLTLKLVKKNHATIREETPSIKGMLHTMQSVLTWGEVSADVEKKLASRGKGGVFALNPPRGGYGRKGVKARFDRGGAVGPRGQKINDLIERMM